MNCKSDVIFKISAALCSIAFSAVSLSDQQFILKDSPDDPGQVILFPDGAQLDVAVTPAGISLTVPNTDLRVRCLGNPTAEGYCLIEAGGGGSVAPEGDADSDGVPDSKDSCDGTSSGSFVNSVGCSQSQLGNDGSDPEPADSDGDGEPDTTDNCPSDANSDQADSDGDGIGNVCDPSPNGGSDPTVTAYCSNSQSSRVDCRGSRNLDTWHNSQGEVTYTVPEGKILSLPFSTRESSSDGADFVHSADRGPLDSSEYVFNAWVSKLPGGAELSSKCKKTYTQARFTLTLTQFSVGCRLGSAEGTFYINYAVRGDKGYLNEDYRFQLERAGTSG